MVNQFWIRTTIWLIVCVYTLIIEGKSRQNLCLIEGDIRCPRKVHPPSIVRKQRSRYRFTTTAKRSYTNGPRDFNMLWPTRTIHYKIGYAYSSSQLSLLQAAIKEIESFSCIKFVQVTNSQQAVDYVLINRGKGCYSDVGRTGNEQQLSLDFDCFNRKTLLHELLHTIGFWHEHNRPDRDNYVQVIRENIDPAKLSNFKITDEYMTYTGPWDYDYFSVMHYKHNEYSRDGKMSSLLPIDSTVQSTDLGSSNFLTKRDIDKINSLYRCDITTCPSPILNEHIRVTNPSVLKGEIKIGTQITYQCDANGFTLTGSSTQTCLASGEWSGQHPHCIPVVYHYCDFESNGLCGWKPLTGDTDWEVSSGRQNYRIGTGPITDLTLGTLDGHYLKLDTQSLDVGMKASISTPTLPLTNQGTTFCLSFGYYMWGLVVGNLRAVLLQESTASKDIFFISGAQGPKWIVISVPFIPETNFKIQFEATIASEMGDIAIDDVSIEPCSLTNSQSTSKNRKSKSKDRPI